MSYFTECRKRVAKKYETIQVLNETIQDIEYVSDDFECDNDDDTNNNYDTNNNDDTNNDSDESIDCEFSAFIDSDMKKLIEHNVKLYVRLYHYIINYHNGVLFSININDILLNTLFILMTIFYATTIKICKYIIYIFIIETSEFGFYMIFLFSITDVIIDMMFSYIKYYTNTLK
jgi:phage shock protein PspC (stress-responsive transcriptional regulator)